MCIPLVIVIGLLNVLPSSILCLKVAYKVCLYCVVILAGSKLVPQDPVALWLVSWYFCSYWQTALDFHTCLCMPLSQGWQVISINSLLMLGIKFSHLACTTLSQGWQVNQQCFVFTDVGISIYTEHHILASIKCSISLTKNQKYEWPNLVQILELLPCWHPCLAILASSTVYINTWKNTKNIKTAVRLDQLKLVVMESIQNHFQFWLFAASRTKTSQHIAHTHWVKYCGCVLYVSIKLAHTVQPI